MTDHQARAEDYSEAVAFVRLLNALWRGAGGAAPDGGRGVGHYSKFVREELLGTAFQRAYKDERQRWQLVAACLEHCELTLAGLGSGEGERGAATRGGGGRCCRWQGWARARAGAGKVVCDGGPRTVSDPSRMCAGRGF